MVIDIDLCKKLEKLRSVAGKISKVKSKLDKIRIIRKLNKTLTDYESFPTDICI